MTNINLDQGTFTINHAVTASSTFTTDAGTQLVLGASGSIGGSGAFSNATSSVTYLMSSTNVMPLISMSAGSTLNGTVIVTSTNNFIAAGNYVMLNAPSVSSTGSLTFNNSRYVSGTKNVSSTQVYLAVTRDGYQNHALTPYSQQIGSFLETIGASSPTATQFDLLNYLDSTTTDQELTAALLSITPPSYTRLQTLADLSNLLYMVETRLSRKRFTDGYASGDYSFADHGVWIRPYLSSGNQKQKGGILPYSSRSDGLAFGLDNKVTDGLTLGVVGIIGSSKITDSTNTLTHTNIKTYQAMLYGSYQSKNDSYFDWLINAGVNNYNGSRRITTTSISDPITAKYAGNQFAIKARYSKDFVWAQYLQLTPHVSAQYSYLQGLPYSESGGSDLSMLVSPQSVNMITLGAGGKIAAPFTQGPILLVPGLHLMFTGDVKGGAVATNSQFSAGGPTLSASVQAGRFMVKLGASVEFKFLDKLNIIANYDLDTRSFFYGHSAYLNLRYTF